MQVRLGKRAYRKRARRISRRCPAPAAVETEALILDDREHTTATEGLGVRLTLDLQHVQGEEDDLADADKTVVRGQPCSVAAFRAAKCSPSRRRVHDGLARLLAKSILKVLAVVSPEEVARHRLAAVLVHALEDLVPGRIPQPREERHELPPRRRRGLVLEDDLVELRHR